MADNYYTFAPSLTNTVFCLLRFIYDLSSRRAFFHLEEYCVHFLINYVQSIGFGSWNKIKIYKSFVYVAESLIIQSCIFHAWNGNHERLMIRFYDLITNKFGSSKFL